MNAVNLDEVRSIFSADTTANAGRFAADALGNLAAELQVWRDSQEQLDTIPRAQLDFLHFFAKRLDLAARLAAQLNAQESAVTETAPISTKRAKLVG